MLSQKETTDSETDWKKQYAQTLNELDAKEKAWEVQQQELLKALLRLTFTFQGSNDILDKKLLDLKDGLKKTKNKLPQNDINQIIEAILKLQKEKNAETSRTSLLISNVTELLSKDEQFSPYSNKLNEITDDEKGTPIHPSKKLKTINEILAQINKSVAGGKQKPDSFKVFLKKLSENKKTEPALAALCKKSISLKTEQEKLKAINSCIESINSTVNNTEKNGAEQNGESPNSSFSIENLVILLDWITIPGKSQNKLETLKQQLEQRTDNKDIGNLLRRIALVISNAYMEIQSELNETEDFLKKVTQQLNEITLQIADIETLENESFSSSLTHNTAMEKQIKLIQSGVDEADTIENIKNTINTRIEVLQTNMDQFINVEQSRKKQSANSHKKLVDQIKHMESETDQLRQCIEEERSKAYNDALTGIPNRMAYDEQINSEYQRRKRYNGKLTLCLIDIDKFKGVNDTYGHKAGDIVLRTVAKKCASKVRKNDFFCRYGGEEFALILPETNLSAAITVAETLRQSIEKCSFQYGDKNVPITISCGLAEFKAKDTPAAVFLRSDKALYKAKETGRNRCVSEEELHVI